MTAPDRQRLADDLLSIAKRLRSEKLDYCARQVEAALAEVERQQAAIEQMDEIAATLVRCPDLDVQRLASELHALAALSSVPSLPGDTTEGEKQ
jgi:hypothetical protein